MGVSSALSRGYPSYHYSWVAFVPSLMRDTCYIVLQLITHGLGEVSILSLPHSWVSAVFCAMGIRRVLLMGGILAVAHGW